jgi:phage shock protein PspC (stress-responsive transcriptional regulator)
MKQVININFHGQVVPIEVSAFDLLKNYTASLSRFFADEEGKEEIINDIESRIGELFQERLKKGATCITDDDVNAIIKSMGTPDDFEIDEEKVHKAENGKKENSAAQPQAPSAAAASAAPKRLYRDENNKVLGGVCGGLANYFGIDPVIVRIVFAVVSLAFGTGILAYIILWIAVPSTASTVIGGTRKKLFRDPDDKIVAGVCSGIGNYFGINPWIPRVLFLLPFLGFVFHFGNIGFFDFPNFFRFSFSPGSLILYIILWLAFPEASNTAEKLEMKGAKVDIDSIKNSVVEEMKGVQKRAEKFGQEAKSFATEKGEQMGAEVKNAAKRSGRSLGDVIVLIVKVFGYFIIGVVSFTAVVALFALAIFSVGIFPFKDYVLTDGWQNALAWGTLLFFIAVPVIGVITWIIRRLAKMKSNRKVLRASFISLWVIGWVCFICMLASISKDFRSGNNLFEQEITLQNPRVQKLVITNHSASTKFLNSKWLRFEPFNGIDEDSAIVNNVEVRIVKSTTDSFKVTMVKMARGSNRRYADTLANKILFNAVQQDSVLLLDKGFAITRTDKFRNQKIIMIVYVPVGKQIKIDNGVRNGFNIHLGDSWENNQNEIDMNNEESNWQEGVDYMMKADGLYTLDGTAADEWKSEGRSKVKIGPGGIEVRDGKSKVTIDGNGINIDENYRYDDKKAMDKIDSLKIKLEKEQQQVKDSLEKVKERINKQLEKIDNSSTSASEAGSANYNSMLLMNPVTFYL